MNSITVPPDVLIAMRIHARNEAPNEACGLLAGTDDRVCFFYPLDNVAASADRFVVDPVGHMRALHHAERSGWELIGVFHSHPDGPPVPSTTDVDELFEPHWLAVIAGGDDVKGWRCEGGGAREVELTNADLRPAP